VKYGHCVQPDPFISVNFKSIKASGLILLDTPCLAEDLVSETEFDENSDASTRGLDYWADPSRRHSGAINH
jgi:hypothetical protein